MGRPTKSIGPPAGAVLHGVWFESCQAGVRTSANVTRSQGNNHYNLVESSL